MQAKERQIILKTMYKLSSDEIEEMEREKDKRIIQREKSVPVAERIQFCERRVCPQCKREYDDTWRVCLYDGTELQSKNGKIIPKEDKKNASMYVGRIESLFVSFFEKPTFKKGVQLVWTIVLSLIMGTLDLLGVIVGGTLDLLGEIVEAWGKYDETLAKRKQEEQERKEREERRIISMKEKERMRINKIRREERKKIKEAENGYIREREPISQEAQDAVWNRDGGKCVKCGSRENLEFDHIIPFSKGGSNTKRNLQLLCERCNREKSNNIG